MPAFRDETTLAVLASGAAVVYALMILLFLGRAWLVGFRR
jgi:hypothetical protein